MGVEVKLLVPQPRHMGLGCAFLLFKESCLSNFTLYGFVGQLIPINKQSTSAPLSETVLVSGCGREITFCTCTKAFLCYLQRLNMNLKAAQSNSW